VEFKKPEFTLKNPFNSREMGAGGQKRRGGGGSSAARQQEVKKKERQPRRQERNYQNPYEAGSG